MITKISEKMKDGFILSILAAFCGGAVPVAAKVALEVFQPFTVISLRFLFASLFLFPFVYRSKEIKIDLLKNLSKVAVIGSLNPILLFIALPFTKASVSPLIYACVPALTLMYMHLILKKTVSPKQILGIFVGFIGVTIIILLPVLQKSTNISALAGNLLIFGAAIAFMFYGIVSKKKQQEVGVSPLALTFYFSVITLFISLPFTIRELAIAGITYSIGIQHIFSGVFVGVVGTGIFYLAYQYALKLGSELAAALFTYLQPIATILLAALFLGEKITIPFVVGGILAVVGARIAANSTPK